MIYSIYSPSLASYVFEDISSSPEICDFLLPRTVPTSRSQTWNSVFLILIHLFIGLIVSFHLKKSIGPYYILAIMPRDHRYKVK